MHIHYPLEVLRDFYFDFFVVFLFFVEREKEYEIRWIGRMERIWEEVRRGNIIKIYVSY